jgi:WD40 repeat protein/serine/threonine protein kinase
LALKGALFIWMNQEETIFERALGIDPSDKRNDYLREACAGDVAMFERLQGLLLAYDRAGKFLEHESRAEGGSCEAADTVAPPATLTIGLPLTEKPGDRIGRYKLLQQIGEGGCGVVYMAEQEKPVHRRVALKVIKLGMDTKQVIARFEAERQALAMMDHPNIAKVLDGGATKTGRPYFVMDLVRGVKITEYCDHNNLPTKERLELFIQVCRAIQHAHQKGIIHRDVKPSNILVTLHDGVAVPKVIDFGIAKATQGRLTDMTLFTAFEQFIGTPAYMSPEQAEISGLDVDTRSDIYSLGVLLYELLTGQTPFDVQELMAAGLDAMRRTIREKEPDRPSTKLSTMVEGELTATAKRHHTEAPKLVSAIRGDLDWIVMKCLEKDRSRRYETANGLARDIQRHLNQEPVTASPPSAAYRFRKLVRRNKLMFAAGGTVVAALVLGLGLSAWLFLREKQARQRADAAEETQSKLRLEAETERGSAERISAQNKEYLYAARIHLAQRAYDEGNMVQFSDLLESLRPGRQETDLRGFEWYYLHRLLHMEKIQLPGHTNGARAVAFSPDGAILATAGADSRIVLWNATTGLERSAFFAHKGVVNALAFSPDGNLLASGGDDRMVRIWSVQDARGIFALGPHSNEVSCVAFSPDGRLVVSATKPTSLSETGPAISRFSGVTEEKWGNGQVKLWDINQAKSVLEFIGHRRAVLSVAFSPDGKTLATAGADATVRLWDASTGVERFAFQRHLGPVYAVAFSPDGGSLLTGSHDQTALFWEGATGRLENIFAGHAGPVFCSAFSPNGKLAATGGYDNVVRLWDTGTGSESLSLRGQNNYIWALAFSPDGRTLATASWDGTVNLWDLNRRGEFDAFETDSTRGLSSNFSVDFSPDGKELALGSDLLTIFTAEDLRPAFRFPGRPTGNIVARYSGDGKFLVTIDIDGVLRVFDTATRTQRVAIQAASNQFFGLAISPDSKTIATGDFDGDLRLWDIATGENELVALPSKIHRLAFSPDGRTLAAVGRTLAAVGPKPGSSPGQVLCLVEFPGHRLRSVHLTTCPLTPDSVAFSPDGKTLAIGVWNGPGVALWDTRTERIRASLMGHRDGISGAAFSPDGKTLATASWDGTIRLWQVSTGSELLTLKGQTKGVMWCVAFSPDGRQLVAGSGRDVTGNVIARWIAAPRAASVDSRAPKQGSSPVIQSPKSEGESRAGQVKLIESH